MVRLGPGPGRISRHEITWKKTKNTVSDRMEDDSLVHLFTEKKIKRRTKLLNSQLRKVQCAKLSYSEYIKVKTAVLRILSEDELTDDEPISDTVGEIPADSLESQKRSLEVLLQEMILESPGSDDEPRSSRRTKNLSVEKESSEEPQRSPHREEPLSTSKSQATCNPPTVIKRPRGRPRKVNSKVAVSETNCNDKSLRTSKKNSRAKSIVQVTSARSEIVNSDEEELITPYLSNTPATVTEKTEKVVTTPETRENHKLEEDPLAVEEGNDFSGGISEKSHEDVFDNKDEVVNITDNKYNTDDEEFFTPNTSDCEGTDDDKNAHLTYTDQYNNCAENFLKNDDMFEEEKMIVHSKYDTENYVGRCENYTDNRDEQDTSKTEDQSQKSQDTIVEGSFAEEEKKDVLKNLNFKEESFDTSKSDIFSDTDELVVKGNGKSSENPSVDEKKTETVDNIMKEDSFAQEQDAGREQTGNDIEKYINKAVKEFDEKFVKDSNSPTHQPISYPEKTQVITQNSPKTPADIKRNLLTTLNHLSNECSPDKRHHTDNCSFNQPISNADLQNANPDDQVNSVVTGDSGIDEDSEDILFQDYLKRKEAETDESSEVSSPLKRKLNLKIKSTEVVKSKYMIIRDNRRRGISESSSLPQRSPQKALEGIQEEESEDISLRWEESENEENRIKIVPFRTQLNEFDSDESECSQNYSQINRRYANFTGDSNYREAGTRKKVTPLSAPSQSESLKCVLNSLLARQKYVTNLYQEELMLLEQEQEVRTEVIPTEEEGESQEADTPNEVSSRPTSIPEFIEGTDLVPLEMSSSLTLGDLEDDDDIYLMEIPKSILEQNLKGKRFKLKKGKIIIGEDRYDVQQTDGEPMSFILHSGDRRKRYKTGIIEPLKHVVVKHQVRDDLVQVPKLESEIKKCVPFPVNVKPRNPLILFNNASLDTQCTSPNTMGRKIHETPVKSKKRKVDSQVALTDCVSGLLDSSKKLKESKKRRKLYEVNKLPNMSVTNSHTELSDIELNFKEKKRKRTDSVKIHKIKEEKSAKKCG